MYLSKSEATPDITRREKENVFTIIILLSKVQTQGYNSTKKNSEDNILKTELCFSSCSAATY